MLITLDELLHYFDWERACEIKGLNPYCVAEGADPEADEHFTLDEYEQLIGKKEIKKCQIQENN